MSQISPPLSGQSPPDQPIDALNLAGEASFSGAPSPKSAGVDWYSVVQFGLSLLAVLSLWGMALSAGVAGLVQRMSGAASSDEALPLFLMASGMAFTGMLLLPSAWYSLSRLLGKPVGQAAAPSRWLRPTVLIFMLPVFLLAGYWVAQRQEFSWLLLPPIHALAIGLPILWLTYLGTRELPIGSPQRAWGVFASGAVLAPLMIIIAEVAALLAGLAVWLGAVASSSELTTAVKALAERLQNSTPSPEAALEILQPWLSNPAVILSGLVFTAVIVPLIEEAIKPVGVWLLAGRAITPAEGFAAGVLSGTGYALIESLLLSSGSGEDWAFLVFARIGTGVVHILTTGLVGWALALAWRQDRYLRLGAVYLLAVLIHGLWNGLTLVSAFTSLTPAHTQALAGGALARIGQLAPYALVGIACASFLALVICNRTLARMPVAPTAVEIENIV